MLFLKYIGVRSPVVGWKTGPGPLFRRWRYNNNVFEHAIQPPLNAVREASVQRQPNRKVPVFRLYIPPEDREWATHILEKIGGSFEYVLAISPGSIREHKKWPIANYISLSRQLAMKFEAYFIVVGTGEDIDDGEAILKAQGVSGLNLCGQTTIQQLAAILELCRLTIGNDGGSMHVAAAVGCRCVAIISGIEYPGAIDPWGNQRWSIRHKIECAPCYSFAQCPKGHCKCVRDIGVDEVVKKCIDALAISGCGE